MIMKLGCSFLWCTISYGYNILSLPTTCIWGEHSCEGIWNQGMAWPVPKNSEWMWMSTSQDAIHVYAQWYNGAPAYSQFTAKEISDGVSTWWQRPALLILKNHSRYYDFICNTEVYKSASPKQTDIVSPIP